MVKADSGGAQVKSWAEMRMYLYPQMFKGMDIEIDLERIQKEEAWWWISKIMNAYYALNTQYDDLDSGLL